MVEGRGLLVLCAAPIGNVADAPARLAEMLATADVVAAEDTRRLHRLTAHLGIKPSRVVSFFEGNETARASELLAELEQGATVALITDAGMPSVSDPGYRLVRAAAAAGVRVTVVPGPSAVTAAIAVSGLPVDRWCMEGFLPRKSGERTARLRSLSGETRTMVFFEAPHRLAACLADMAGTFGASRPAVVCRELTKTYEEVRRGALSELAEWASDGVRGEITVVVGGAPAVAYDAAPEQLAALVAGREAAGQPRKEALAEVAGDLGIPKRQVFDAVVAAKPGSTKIT
jgi:16S rRNA (cytidine1402-2'-O)-methyltransferase